MPRQATPEDKENLEKAEAKVAKLWETEKEKYLTADEK